MIHFSPRDIATILQLEQPSTTSSFRGISIDTRTLQPGNLFVALSGSRVDGHDFLEQALERGAAAALVTHLIDLPLPQIKVTDTTLALGKLTAAWRNRFTLPLLAVTGSNGKTTLKNMLASILQAACKGNREEVLATQGTLNNQLGVPLTLSSLTHQHRYGVIEMGMNHFGEIAYLTKLVQPQVAVITNAGAAHLAGVSDIAGVARAKAEIFAGLAKDGTAILNRDDAFFSFWREQIGSHAYLTFGLHPDADISVLTGTGPLLMRTPRGEIPLCLPLLGKHNIQNALAATAAALAVGVKIDAIAAGLTAMQAAPGRLQQHAVGQVTVIDDSYNANPLSLEAAVATLAAFPSKKIMVLGDMKELGSDEIILHRTAGDMMRQAGIDYLFTYGELTAHTAEAFGAGANHFTEQVALIDALKSFLPKQAVMLVKGSRSMHMEKVVEALIKQV